MPIPLLIVYLRIIQLRWLVVVFRIIIPRLISSIVYLQVILLMIPLVPLYTIGVEVQHHKLSTVPLPGIMARLVVVLSIAAGLHLLLKIVFYGGMVPKILWEQTEGVPTSKTAVLSKMAMQGAMGILVKIRFLRTLKMITVCRKNRHVLMPGVTSLLKPEV